MESESQQYKEPQELSLEFIERRFRELDLYKSVITSQIRAESKNIQKLGAQLDEYNLESRLSEISNGLPTTFKELGKSLSKRILETEVSIQRWSNEHSEDELMSIVGITEGYVERMVGGFAIIVSPETFNEKVVKSIYIDGQEQNSSENLNSLGKLPQAGFVTNIDKLSSNHGLDKDTKIMIILDNHRSDSHHDYVRRAMSHEEREGIGISIDLVKSMQHNPKLANSLHDIAARLADHETNINISDVGFSPKDINNPELNVINSILKGVNKKVSSGKNPKELASELQGAILFSEDPWSIASYVNEGKTKNELLFEQSNTQPEFEGVALESKIEGRFVYNTATLKPGDTIQHHLIEYTVKDIIGKGGFGVVYEAIDNAGKKVAIKEVVIDAPQALCASSGTARSWVEGIIDSKTDPNNPNQPNPSLVLAEIRNRLMPQPKEQHESQHEFAKAFLGYLDITLDQRLSQKLNSNNQNYYRGNLQFNWPLDSNGKPIIEESLRKETIDVLIDAISKYPKLSGSEVQKISEKIIDRSNYSGSGSRQQDIFNISNTLNPSKVRERLDESVTMFIGESETLTRLQGIKGTASSRGIVRSGIYDENNPKYDSYYMVQEFAEGTKYSDEIRSKKWTVQQTIDFTASILSVLQKVHERGVVHKDIKPENIYVESDRSPIILDFGIAKSRFTELNIAKDAQVRTGTTKIGTPVYSSPEHLIGGTDQRSDIYSVGIMLYESVTGEDIHNSIGKFHPLDTTNRINHIDKVLSQTDSRGSLIYPKEIKEIILKAVSESPSNRFQSAYEMQSELEKIKLITHDTYLDSLKDQLLNYRFQRGAYSWYSNIDGKNTWQSENFGAIKRTRFGLPPEYETYLDELISRSDKDPNSFSDAFNRLNELTVNTNPVPSVIAESFPRVIHDISLKLSIDYISKGNYLSPQELDQLVKLSGLNDSKDILIQHLKHNPDLSHIISIICSNNTKKNYKDRDIQQSLKNSNSAIELISKCMENTTTNPSMFYSVGTNGLDILEKRIAKTTCKSDFYFIGDGYWSDGDYSPAIRTKYALPTEFTLYLDQIKASFDSNPSLKSQCELLLDNMTKANWPSGMRSTINKVVGLLKEELKPPPTNNVII